MKFWILFVVLSVSAIGETTPEVEREISRLETKIVKLEREVSQLRADARDLRGEN